MAGWPTQHSEQKNDAQSASLNGSAITKLCVITHTPVMFEKEKINDFKVTVC